MLVCISDFIVVFFTFLCVYSLFLSVSLPGLANKDVHNVIESSRVVVSV